MKKEVVKAEAIRKGAFNDALLNQGWIDCINFVIGEPSKQISRLSNQIGDQEPEGASNVITRET